MYCIYDTSTLQSVLLQHDAAGFARAMCTALRAEAPSCSSTGTVTDTATIPTVSIGTEAVADDMVDTDVAEAMVAEASTMLDQAEERARLAEARALEWCDRAELTARMLRKEEEHTDDARAALQTAKDLQRCEQAARQMVERLLAMEAALADAAVERSMREYKGSTGLRGGLAWVQRVEGEIR